MSRRQFLQALLAIPAIAALPLPAQVLPMLSGDDRQLATATDSLFQGYDRDEFVTINGRPIEVRSLSWYEDQDFIEVSSFYTNHRSRYSGMNNGSLVIESYYDPGNDAVAREVFRQQAEVVLRARIHGIEFVATGFVRRAEYQTLIAEPVLLQLEMVLTNVRWES